MKDIEAALQAKRVFVKRYRLFLRVACLTRYP